MPGWAAALANSLTLHAFLHEGCGSIGSSKDGGSVAADGSSGSDLVVAVSIVSGSGDAVLREFLLHLSHAWWR